MRCFNEDVEGRAVVSWPGLQQDPICLSSLELGVGLRVADSVAVTAGELVCFAANVTSSPYEILYRCLARPTIPFAVVSAAVFWSTVSCTFVVQLSKVLFMRLYDLSGNRQ